MKHSDKIQSLGHSKGMMDGDEQDGAFEEEIQATLCFVDPKPEDAPGIAIYIPKSLKVHRPQLANYIANQTRVGTLIKDQNEDGSVGDSLFGISTCINLAKASIFCPTIVEMIEWMKELNDPVLNEILIGSLPVTGLILSERASGVPLILSPHLARGLFSEIEWATHDLETEEERNSFNFQFYITPIKMTIEEGETLFSQVEQELYFNHAVAKVEYDQEGEEGDLVEVEYHRYIAVLTAETIPTIRQELNNMFDVDESQYADEGRI